MGLPDVMIITHIQAANEKGCASMMVIEIKLPWQDIVCLIHDPYGWRNRYELDLGFGGSTANSFTWHGKNYQLIVTGGGEESCLLGLFMDNGPVDAAATRTWEKIQALLSRFGTIPNPTLEDTTGYDITLITMWNEGYDRGEIAQRVGRSPDRITNRITELRNKYGEEFVPKRKEKIMRLIRKS